MYQNYGAKNFFEYGRLVESIGDKGTEFSILCCNPYSDHEDLYQFGECTVAIGDSWIDHDAVLNWIGMTEDSYDAVLFALGCLDYYGAANFGAQSYAYDWEHMNRKGIIDILKHRDIEGGLESVVPEECL